MALGWGYSLGARNVWTKNPVPTAADLKGVKLRVLPVPNFIATIKYMGAVPTPLPFGEIYTALQTGVVDGFEHDAPTALAGKFYEVAKHCALTQHIYNPQLPCISKRSFERIPTDLQQAVPGRGDGSDEVSARQGLRSRGEGVRHAEGHGTHRQHRRSRAAAEAGREAVGRVLDAVSVGASRSSTRSRRRAPDAPHDAGDRRRRCRRPRRARRRSITCRARRCSRACSTWWRRSRPPSWPSTCSSSSRR